MLPRSWFDTTQSRYKTALYGFALLAIVSTVYVSDELYSDMTHIVTVTREMKDRGLGISTLGLRSEASRLLEQSEEQKKRIYSRGKQLNLTWLTGYPFTGSEATLDLVEYCSNKSMATNYGDIMATADGEDHRDEFDSEVIDDILFPNGPFWHNKDLAKDGEHVLVKTFCAGTCLHNEEGVNCTETEYLDELVNFTKFMQHCQEGRSFKLDNAPEGEVAVSGGKGTKELMPMYETTRLRKTVVLIRNPFEIVASRFREFAKKDEVSYAKKTNQNGLKQWCKATDDRHRNYTEFERIYDDRILTELMPYIYCFTEFWRIVKWYNNFCLYMDNNDHHIVRFEDYSNNLDQTVQGIFDYVGMESVPGRHPIFHRTDRDYEWFAPMVQLYTVKFMRRKATQCTWDMMGHYFPDSWTEDFTP